MKRTIILSLMVALVATGAKAQDPRAATLKGAPTIGIVANNDAQPDLPSAVKPGEMRFNSQMRTMEFFDGMNWVALVTSSGGGR
jgi:hypothetical protein